MLTDHFFKILYEYVFKNKLNQSRRALSVVREIEIYRERERYGDDRGREDKCVGMKTQVEGEEGAKTQVEGERA